jgi:hypothetical protein
LYDRRCPPGGFSRMSSSVLSSLPSIDLKRALAHVFPGFLLYVGLLMAIDTFLLGQQSALTSILFNPSKTDIETLATVIIIGLFVGSILGVMIDGIGHWIFEDRMFEKLIRNRPLSEAVPLKIEDAENIAYEYWMKIHKITSWYIKPKAGAVLPNGGIDPKFPKTADYFYPLVYQKKTDEDKIKLKDELINSYYSYYEFYINSSISVFLISLIFPLYSVKILTSDFLSSIFISAIIMTGSILLFFASIHTLADYRRARLFSIEGYLRKQQA